VVGVVMKRRGRSGEISGPEMFSEHITHFIVSAIMGLARNSAS